MSHLVLVDGCACMMNKYEPRNEKSCLRGFHPGLTQTGLYNHKRCIEACNLRFMKMMDCTM